MRQLCTAVALAAALACGLLPSHPVRAAIDTAVRREAAWQQHESMVRDSIFRGMHWNSIGPVAQGGRVVALAGVPGQPYTFYVAYATGGVWKTTDNGQHFAPIGQNLPTGVIGAIAVDPSHPQTLWVGTGEANSSRSSFGGMGVFRSDDGGKTFRAVGLAASDRIARIVIDPKDGNTVYVAALGKLYSTGGQRGVYLTRDGGRTWRRVLSGSSPWTGAIDLAMDPRDSQVLYAALWDRERTAWNFRGNGSGSGLWKSTDGGVHWTRLRDGFPTGADVGRIGISIAPSDPNVVYASVDDWGRLPPNQRELGDNPLSLARLAIMDKQEFLRQSPAAVEAFIRDNDLPAELDAAKLTAMVRDGTLSMDQLRARLKDANPDLFDISRRGLEVFRSDDGGAHWMRANKRPLREVYYTYGYYFGRIQVAPDDARRVYVQGMPMIVSDDGGATWHGLNAPNMHVDYHDLMIDPAFPARMLAATDGGPYLSYDGGKHWQALNAQAVGQFYTVSYDFAEPFNVYGGLQDNGVMEGPSTADPDDPKGDGWKAINGGDGMFVLADPRDNGVVYSGSQFGWYQRSGPKGIHEVRPRAPLDTAPLRYNWTTPIALSPQQPDTLYFGANYLYRSLDRGIHWQAISPELAPTQHHGNVPFGTITTLAPSPLRYGVLWVGTDTGDVWTSDDGGVRWHEVDAGLPKRWVSRVEPSHFDVQRAYVSLNGYRMDDGRAYLYRTDDDGRHWTSIARGLPAECIHVVREDPHNPDVLYVGTNRGVYVSLDRGAHWMSLQANLPTVPVHDLAIQPRDRVLIAGTHGRSVWTLDALPIEELTPALRAKALHLFAVANLHAKRDWWRKVSPWFDTESDAPRLDGSFWARDTGTAEFTVLDAAGMPVKHWQMEAHAGINLWQWNLLMNARLAQAAEDARLTRDHVDTATANWSLMPVRQAIALGQPLRLMPGHYSLRVQLDGATSTSDFVVEAPKPFKPRTSQPWTPRTRDYWTRRAPGQVDDAVQTAAAEQQREASGAGN